MIQPSQISYSGRLSASQMPKTRVPTPPTPQRISATSLLGRVIGAAEDERGEDHDRGPQEERRQHVPEEEGVVHRGAILPTPAADSRQAAAAYSRMRCVHSSSLRSALPASTASAGAEHVDRSDDTRPLVLLEDREVSRRDLQRHRDRAASCLIAEPLELLDRGRSSRRPVGSGSGTSRRRRRARGRGRAGRGRRPGRAGAVPGAAPGGRRSGRS